MVDLPLYSCAPMSFSCPQCSYPAPRRTVLPSFEMVSCDHCGYFLSRLDLPGDPEEEFPQETQRKREYPTLGKMSVALTNGGEIVEGIESLDSILFWAELIRKHPEKIRSASYTKRCPESGLWKRHILKAGSTGEVLSSRSLSELRPLFS